MVKCVFVEKITSNVSKDANHITVVILGVLLQLSRDFPALKVHLVLHFFD